MSRRLRSTSSNMFRQPAIAHTVAFAEGTFNPVAQMGNPECFKLFTKDELDAIQWDSLEEEMARSIEYDIVPDYDKLLDIMTAAKREACRRVSARAILELSAVSKAFGSLTAVDRIDLEIMEGEFFTIVGPSGSGKTTLLRMLAGHGDRRPPATSWLRGKRINDMPGQPAADLHGVPVAGAVPTPLGRREHRVLA